MEISYDAIPRAARTRWVVSEAARFVIENDIRQLPVDVRQIIHREGWILHSYGYIANSYALGMTIKDVCAMLGSTDAATFINDYGVPVICYNETVASKERIEWSLLHEVGHLKLGHFWHFDMFNMSDAQRKTLDIEADTWAANVRAPICVVDLLKKPLREDYRFIFGLSKEGWIVRHRTASRDRRALSAEYAEALIEQFSDFMYGRVCASCGKAFIGGKEKCACPSCGSTQVKWAYHNDIRERVKPPIPRSVKRASAIAIPPAKKKDKPSFSWGSLSWASSTRDAFKGARHYFTDPMIDDRMAEYYLTENPMVVDSYWA